MLSTSTELDVMMGERRPEVGKVGNQQNQMDDNGSYLIRLAPMAEWRRQLESIVSSTFPSASRFHSAFIRTSLVSVNHHTNNPGEEAIRAHGEDPWERREGVEGGPGHQCDDARRQDQRQRDQPQAWQVRHVQGNLNQIVGSPTLNLVPGCGWEQPRRVLH